MKALKRAALISAILAIVKLLAYSASSSVILLATALDSIIDCCLSFMNHWIYKSSREEADHDHQFGHGGYEVIASLAQGLVITGIGVFVIFEGTRRLIDPQTRTAQVNDFPLAIAVLVLAAFAGFALHFLVHSEDKKNQENGERSLALQADSKHYLSDFFTNMGAALGLVITIYTDHPILDPLLGTIGGSIVIISAIPIIKSSLSDILNSSLPLQEQLKIVATIEGASPEVLGVDRLRTRRYGPIIFTDFHLRLQASTPLNEAHAIGEEVRRALIKAYVNIDVSIRLDPDTLPRES